jgi:hypothetical protein
MSTHHVQRTPFVLTLFASSLVVLTSACEVPDEITININRPPASAVDPEPPSGSGGVELAPVLEWEGGGDPDGDPVTFDVYLGPVEPLPLVASTSEPVFAAPERLHPEVGFSWRVVARDVHGETTESDTWSFRTRGAGGLEHNQAPAIPTNPVPADDAAEVGIEATLSWSGGADPDQDLITFDIHFGTANPPHLVATQSGVGYDPFGDLDHGTRYYWQLVVRDEEGATTRGPVWSFLTVPLPNLPPSVPALPEPVDGAIDGARAAILSWSGRAAWIPMAIW